jgi:Sulfotransferase family
MSNPVLFIAYSRSGATLLNRCLAVMPKTMVLSEVNPQGGGWGALKENSYTTIKDQAKNWFNIDIVATDFKEAALEFFKKAGDQGYIPVLRDWSHVNFNASENNNFNPPNRLLTWQSLKDVKGLKTIVLVRDAVDVFISSKAKDTKLFFKSYRNYVSEISKLDTLFIRYEDFCEDPLKVMRTICDYTGIQFTSDFVNTYKNYFNVNGDVQLGEKSNNLQSDDIKIFKRKIIGRKRISEINGNADFIFCNNTLKYKTTYYNKDRGTGKLQYFLRSIFK